MLANVFRRTYGEIRLISVLEPQPGHDGFFRVVSTKVQLSPLRPQFPTEEDTSEKVRYPTRKLYLTRLKITMSALTGQQINYDFCSKTSTHAMAPESGPFETWEAPVERIIPF